MARYFCGPFCFQGLIMHTEQDLNVAVALLKEKLEIHRGDYITGSKVGEILINQCNFRLKNLEFPRLTLSKLISLYLSDVLTADGVQGGDTLYFVGQKGEPLKVQPEYPFWTAFAKADERRQFAIRDSDKQPTLVEPNADLAGLRVIPKVLLDDIERMKETFVATQSKPGQPEYPSTTTPYLQWVAELRESFGQGMNAWSIYRIERIKELFELRLAGMDINPGDRARLLHFLSESQRKKPKKPQSGTSDSTRAAAVMQDVSERTLHADQVFRDAIGIVISRLSVVELRELKLPAGLMMDAILERTR